MDDCNLLAIRFGEPCPKELTGNWPANSLQGKVELVSHSWHLLVGIPRVTEPEIYMLSGELEVGLYTYKGAIFLPFRANASVSLATLARSRQLMVPTSASSVV